MKTLISLIKYAIKSSVPVDLLFIFAAIKLSGTLAGRSEAEMGVVAFERWAKRSTSATINELVFASKSFTEVATRRRMNQRARYCVPRIKKRFQQLNMKTNVIYV